MEHKILRELEPTYAELRGERIPLMCSMRAAAMMEDALDTPYQKIVEEILQMHADDEPEPPPMRLERSARVISCLARAAGYELEYDDIMSLHATEMSVLTQAALAEMLFKAPTSKKKE